LVMNKIAEFEVVDVNKTEQRQLASIHMRQNIGVVVMM
jgi:hypothetical protein